MTTPSAKTHLTEFKRSITPPNIDIPKEESVESLDEIWSAIHALKTAWLNNKTETCRKEYWGNYAKKASSIPFRLLDDFLLHYDKKSKVAIDLGCGKGDLTKTLLSKGWSVIAVDYSPTALEVVSSTCPQEIKSGHLKVICSSITKYIPDNPVDLVLCRNVLSYINPGKFQALFERIHNLFLKDDATLLGTIFTSE